MAGVIKRAIDLLLAGIGLLCAIPLGGLIALAIKLEDSGPVFHAHSRVGRNGRCFRLVKFRSMVADADGRFGPRQASPGDVRVTRVGRMLRATALDELPQLWNIVRGDMSFVGPRALLPAEIEVNGNGSRVLLNEIVGYTARHSVRPGLTGLAQVLAPRDIPRAAKFRYDLWYIQRQNLWLDLHLIGLSIWISLRGKWGARGRKF
jgi:lipopolysaccharide/colanic/teichoic acid biosynthesis glycosyltransferase